MLHFGILIQLKGMAHFLENVLGLIKGVCRINVPCLLIGTREYIVWIKKKKMTNLLVTRPFEIQDGGKEKYEDLRHIVKESNREIAKGHVTPREMKIDAKLAVLSTRKYDQVWPFSLGS